MELWMDGTERNLLLPGCGSFVGAPYRAVVHSTEGNHAHDALMTYQRTGDYPHFTIDEDVTEQHTAINTGTTALEHPKGTPETNRMNAIQIEVVGYAGHPETFSDAKMKRLFAVLRWLSQQTGLHLTWPSFKAYPASYGFGNDVRMTASQWAAFNAVCGHQHVPNNSHGDPGLIDLSDLNPVRSAMARFPNAVGAVLVPGTSSQVWVVGSDGGVGAYNGARFYGSMGGKPLNAAVCAIVPHGAGGYWLLGRDGGIFAYGDAPGIAPYAPFMDEYRRGVHAVVGGSWDGATLTLFADDGATYALHH